MSRISAAIFSIPFFLVSAAAFARDPEPVPTPDDVSYCQIRTGGFHFLLRSDFTDFGPLTCTHDLVSAQGATLSWTKNLLTGQDSAAADGIAALSYTYRNFGEGALIGYSIAPYVQGDDTYQFEPTKVQAHNGETVTPGGFAEIAFNSPIVSGFDDFRVHGGEAYASTGMRANTFVGEWLPSYRLGRYANIGLPNQIGTSAFYYTISPELMVQYDRLDSGPTKAAIFSTNTEALRIGPEIVVLFNVDPAALPSSWPQSLRDFLGNTSATITNHESWDKYTGKEYSWTMVSASYTFPGINKEPSHLGVTASYGYGNAEATGNKTNQVKIGLAVKF